MSWRRSSWSTYNGNCVDVAADWRKAQASVGNGACLEAAPGGGAVWVRDSKDPGGPILGFTRQQFADFLDGCKAGEFDTLP